MARPTLLTQLWNVVKPPPAVKHKDDKPWLKPKQKQLVFSALGVLAAVGAGLGIYSYLGGAQQRSDAEFQIGMNLMRPGHYDESVGHFTKAIAIRPRAAQAYLERGIAFHYMGEDEQALADFDQAIGLNPDLALAHSARGSIFRSRGDNKKALAEFTAAIALQAHIDIFFERGQTYESLGEHQKAIDDYANAIAEQPDAPYIYRARSLARHNLGDIAGYEADRDKAKALEHLQ